MGGGNRDAVFVKEVEFLLCWFLNSIRDLVKGQSKVPDYRTSDSSSVAN